MMSGRKERGGAAAREEVPNPVGDNLIAAGAVWLPCLTLLQVLATVVTLPDRHRVAGYIRKTWLYLARFDVRRFGTQHYVDLVEAGLSSPLTIHAMCRMSNIQLMVHQGGIGGPSHVYGVSGPIHQAIKRATGYVVMACPGADMFTDADFENFEPVSAPAAVSSGPIARPTVTPQLFVTSPTPSPEPQSPRPVINTNSLRNPHEERQPTTKPQPQFRLQNISTLQPEHAAELAAPATLPYKVCSNNLVYCRLPGCNRPMTAFKTVSAWKLHVRRASCHNCETLCTWCGYRVLVPAHLSAEAIAIHMDAHRKERCVAAPKQQLRARDHSVAYLMELGRDVSHIAVPAEETRATTPRLGKRRQSLGAADGAGTSGLSKRCRGANPDQL